MQGSDLVELAALISREGPALLRDGGRFSSAGMDVYWTASKCRLDRWSRRLKNGCEPRDDAGARGGAKSAAHERACWAACTEILTSEILTRVWSAATAAADRAAGDSEFAPITQSILFGHQEARQRVLQRIAAGRERCREAKQLDELRRVCERWTDLLLAPLAELCAIDAFAHDPARVADFAEDRLDEQSSPTGPQAREIMHASLQATFRRWPAPPSGNADLNGQIAAAIVACLDFDRLDTAGVRLGGLTYGWLFHARVMNAAGAAQRMVDELLEDDRRSARAMPSGNF